MNETRSRPKTNAELKAEVTRLQDRESMVAEAIKAFTEDYHAGCRSGRAEFVQELGAHLKSMTGFEALSDLARPTEQFFTVKVSFTNGLGEADVTVDQIENAFTDGFNSEIGGVEDDLTIEATEAPGP